MEGTAKLRLDKTGFPILIFDMLCFMYHYLVTETQHCISFHFADNIVHPRNHRVPCLFKRETAKVLEKLLAASRVESSCYQAEVFSKLRQGNFSYILLYIIMSYDVQPWKKTNYWLQ